MAKFVVHATIVFPSVYMNVSCISRITSDEHVLAEGGIHGAQMFRMDRVAWS